MTRTVQPATDRQLVASAARRRERCSKAALADVVQRSDGGVVGVREGVEVFLGGGDRGVPHAFFDYLDVGAAGE